MKRDNITNIRVKFFNVIKDLALGSLKSQQKLSNFFNYHLKSFGKTVFVSSLGH